MTVRSRRAAAGGSTRQGGEQAEHPGMGRSGGSNGAGSNTLKLALQLARRSVEGGGGMSVSQKAVEGQDAAQAEDPSTAEH